MQSKTLPLAGREFVISELPLRANAEWRRLFEQKLEPLMGVLGGLHSIQVNNAQDLANIVTTLREVILHSPDMLVELLFAYSPLLREHQEWIEANVYESELLAAMTEVLQLAYPFGSILNLAKSINGAVTTPGGRTSMSLPSPNGRAPKNGQTKRRK